MEADRTTNNTSNNNKTNGKESVVIRYHGGEKYRASGRGPRARGILYMYAYIYIYIYIYYGKEGAASHLREALADVVVIIIIIIITISSSQ